ncbi:MAG: DUF58 domain-containing protein [Blastocatellia bacterium]|nr:DUF58 domain-containing protein [Blastocatellia bacterium]
MNFVFTQRFLWLFAIGLVLLLVGLSVPLTRWALIGYDVLLLAAALSDYLLTEDPKKLQVKRLCEGRFSIGTENSVTLSVLNNLKRTVSLQLKDEYPPALEATGREARLTVRPRQRKSHTYTVFADARGDYRFGDIAVRYGGPLGLIWRQVTIPAAEVVKVYPNIQEAKKNELFAQRNRDLRMGQRRIRHKGQGREFESLREFVTGDEIRHISWSATARRGKLVTRQYQVERSQNIVVMLDCGRLMTSRIDKLTKLDHAINAALSIAYVATAGGDNFGLLTFCRRVETYLPPKHGHGQLNAVLEALYNVHAELIEPSYARAFSYLNTNCRKRALVIILTDLVDRDASAELLAHTSTLLPRHLPLIVTIGDKDLRGLVQQIPATAQEVFEQSVAEELIHQRESALGRIIQLGGLVLDVPTGKLSIELVNKYLEVKERGLL